jgi:DNA-binding transcriptional MerR regulator
MLYLDPDTISILANFTEQNESSDLHQYLNLAVRENGAENYSARVLNHWEKEGVLNDLREGGRGWRKYSPMDRIWIQLVQRLRAFGYPLSRIKVLKENLYDQNVLEFAVIQTGVHRVPLQLVLMEGHDYPFALLQSGNWPEDWDGPKASLQVEIAGLIAGIYPYWSLEGDEGLFAETLAILNEEKPAVQYRSRMFQYLNKKN